MLQTISSFDDICRLFLVAKEILGFTAPGLTNHIFGDGLEILLIKTASPEQYQRKVELLNTFSKTSAPLFYQPILTPDGYVLLISEWKAGAEETDLMPFEPRKATPKQKSEFLEDLSRIADAGLEHPYVTYGYAHWRIDPVTQNIVLTNWIDADFMAPGSRKRYIADIEDLLRL
ncbi:MAG: hypothetical protein MUC92_12630 [Fimbriimonadaceae bacterium]|nr:hypothetical protein [Fimbriimonadaceae bacterium]